MPTERSIVGVLILAGAVVAGGDPAGGAPPRYTITDLGTLGGRSSVAFAVNNNGQVVGSADTPEGKRHAYLWDPETREMTDLGTISPITQSEAWGVNDNAQVVGISTNTGNPDKAFLWDNGQIVGIGSFQGSRLAFLMTPIRADFDDDSDTDLGDSRVLVSCFTGPDERVAGECQDSDIDKTGSVDLADLQAFHWVFTGPEPI